MSELVSFLWDNILRFAGVFSLVLLVWQFREARRFRVNVYSLCRLSGTDAGKILEIDYSLQNRGRPTTLFLIEVCFYDRGVFLGRKRVEFDPTTMSRDAVITGKVRVPWGELLGTCVVLSVTAAGANFFDRRSVWSGEVVEYRVLN